MIGRISDRLSSGRYKVPVLPGTMLRVLDVTNRRDATPKEIAGCIESDAAVAGEVISLVNSVAYMPATPIRDLQRAVVHVGVRRVRELMMAVAARLTVMRGASTNRAQDLWAHSLGVAVVAREIAQRAGGDPGEAFLAGLLHDIGKTVILDVAAEEERKHPGTSLSDGLLQRILDQFHAEAGLQVAKGWRLSDSLCESIAQHHRLVAESPRHVALVALANDVCGSLGIGVPRRPVRFEAHPAFALLGLDEVRGPMLVSTMPGVLAQAPELKGVTRAKSTSSANPQASPLAALPQRDPSNAVRP
jgi:putative nucleotidyltransferase with HDIG domain